MDIFKSIIKTELDILADLHEKSLVRQEESGFITLTRAPKYIDEENAEYQHLALVNEGD